MFSRFRSSGCSGGLCPSGRLRARTVGAVCDRRAGVWPFLPRRRRERTIAGGTRAFFSAYHRNNEAHENRTLNRVRGFLAPCWSADSYWNHHPGVTLAALANPRLISRHASGVAKTTKLQTPAFQGGEYVIPRHLTIPINLRQTASRAFAQIDLPPSPSLRNGRCKPLLLMRGITYEIHASSRRRLYRRTLHRRWIHLGPPGAGATS